MERSKMSVNRRNRKNCFGEKWLQKIEEEFGQEISGQFIERTNE